LKLNKQRKTAAEKRQEKFDRDHKLINGIDHKFCNKHQIFFPEESPWFPANTDYFYHNDKNSIDHLHPSCILCARKKAVIHKANNVEYYKQKDKERYNADKGYRKRQRDRYNLLNPHRSKEIHDAFIKNNPEKQREYRLKREPKNHKISIKEWEACQKYFDYKCAYCGLPITEHWITHKGVTKLGGFHKDHNDENGANDLSNCIPACKSCNCHKWNFNFEDWYRKQEFFTEDRYNKIIKWLTEDYKLYIKDEKSNKSYKYKYINKFSNIVQ